MAARRSGQKDAEKMFGVAAKVLSHSLNIPPAYYYFQEAATLVWPALLEQGCASLSVGKREEAISIFDLILKPDAITYSGIKFAELTEKIVVRAKFERAVGYLQLRKYGQALTGFGEVLSQLIIEPELRAHAYRLSMEALSNLGRDDKNLSPIINDRSPIFGRLSRYVKRSKSS